MKRKIYWNMCLVALFSMVVATLVTTWLFCRDLQEQMQLAVMTEVRYLESAVEVSGEDYLAHLASRGDGNNINRITWIGEDGTVLYDSYADSESLENHRDRPEVSSALKTGTGESVRISDTLAEQTYYYARKLTDGTIIRVASTTRSGLATMVHTVPWMVVMAVVIFGVTMVLAEIQTKRIVDPINRLDPKNPQAEQVYDELAPLVRRLEKQKETIREQMETLREKQEEFTAITENMREGFIVVDSKADVISYNSSAVRILGVDMKKNGNGNINVLSLNRSSSFRQVVDEALSGQRCEQNLDLNGRHYQIIANPVAESENRWGAVVVILDVTEQQNREGLRREFTANVSHELKTPITSIRVLADSLMGMEDAPAELYREFLSDISDEIDRESKIIDDLLTLVRADKSNAELNVATANLNGLLEQILKRLRPIAKKRNIELVFESIRQVSADVDEVKLSLALTNLVENAIKYNHEDGWVHVTLDADHKFFYVKISDNGIGISQEAQEHVFERFYRVDKARSRETGGTGLGLAITKSIVLMHQGAIKLQSREGEGTTFTVRIPLNYIP